jgi:NTP pyrophosphatase (non-canonical NTP hydrolase)
MSTEMSELQTLRKQLKQFANEREWTSFHTPKNLASALAVEAAELLEPFQWLSTGHANELGEQQSQAVADEMADVLSYLILLADQLNVDLYQATLEKIKRNAQKYPVELVKGSAKKYTAY